MTRISRLLALGSAACLCATLGSTACARRDDRTDAAAERRPGLGFIERLAAGAGSDERLPMVVGIHGLGDTPEAFAGVFEGLPVKARIILPRGPADWGPGHSWFDIRLPYADRQEALAGGVAAASDRVVDLLRHLTSTRPTSGRPVITGFSQGGMISFAVAARHPDAVSMAIPIGGALPSSLLPTAGGQAAYPPVLALHGAADEIVPVGRAREAVAALRGLGVDVRMVEYPGLPHTIDNAVRGDLHAAIIESIAP
jgi:phospholipase/carboxylesterase